VSSWDPWRAARSAPHLEVTFARVPEGAVWRRTGAGDVITIDRRATRRERRALLTHELIHAERGIGFPVATAATMQREEAIVRRETARRLVPPDELARFVRRRADVEPVTADLVAEEFDVPRDVAVEALRALRPLSSPGSR